MGRSYPNEIKRILADPGGDVGKEVRAVALDIAYEAKRQTIAAAGRHPGDQPRTGNLAEAYRVLVIPGTNQFVVINPKKYAAAFELGAVPHIIKPRKKTLQFRGRDGRWRRVTYVNHPGSAGRHLLQVSARLVMRRRYGIG